MMSSRTRLLVLGTVAFVVVSAGLLGHSGLASHGTDAVHAVEGQEETTTTPGETTPTTPGIPNEPVLRICDRTIDGETVHIVTSERFIPLMQQRGWSCSRLSPSLIQGLEEGTTTATAGTATETPTTEALANVSVMRVCERRIDDETALIAVPEQDVSLLKSQGWSCGLHLPVLISGLEDGITTAETTNTTQVTTTE